MLLCSRTSPATLFSTSQETLYSGQVLSAGHGTRFYEKTRPVFGRLEVHETLAGVAKRALCASPSAARRGDRSGIEGLGTILSYSRPVKDWGDLIALVRVPRFI